MLFLNKHIVTLLSAFVALVALVLYGYWILTTKNLTVPGVIAAALCITLFALGIVLAIPRALRFLGGENTQSPAISLGDRSRKRSRLHPIIKIMLVALLARIALVIVAYAMYNIVYGYSGSIFETLERIWVKLDTDAPHYISIAENWYPTEYPLKYTLVFLPLFPLLVRGIDIVISNTFASAFILNTLCSCGAAAVIYELALCDMGRRSSIFATVCAFLLPAALFYAAPMSDALFLLLSAATLLALRKEKLWIAAILGALASFTRSVGIVLIVPFAAEAWGICVRYYKSHKNKLPAKLIITAIISTLCVGLGTFAYLLINKLIWNNWFQFLSFQKEIWSQEFGMFFNTASYQMNELIRNLSTKDLPTAWGLWAPNVLYMFSSLAIFVAAARRMRASYAMYFAAYFFVSMGVSWLLSAPRYLTAMAVLPIAIALLCQSRDDGTGIELSRKKSSAVALILVVGQLLYLLMYIKGYKLY